MSRLLKWLCAPLFLLAWNSACSDTREAAQTPAAPKSAESTSTSPEAQKAPKQQDPKPSGAEDETAVANSSNVPLVIRSREMMGTIMQITVVGDESPEIASAIDAAFDEMVRLEQVLSEWIPSSEISRINNQAGIAPVQVSDDTWAVIKAGLDISIWSDGAFDLSWAALRGLYLFQPGEETVPTRSQLEARLPLVNFKNIVVDESKKTVFLSKKGMLIGTGGIGKGYALDRAGQVLQNAGFTKYMLFGGGQVQVLGNKGQRPWHVGIQHPRKNDYFAYLAVDGGSISTSGDYEHAFIRDGRRWHHLLDLKTGLPVEHTTSVTVLADTGLYADALSTAIFAMGAERALSRIESAPANARFVVVDSEQRVHIGGDLREELVFSVQLSDENKLP